MQLHRRVQAKIFHISNLGLLVIKYLF